MAVKRKRFRKQYIPLVVAGLVLVLLITALVLTILYQPKQEKTVLDDIYDLNNVEERIVKSNTCSGEDYDKLMDEISKIAVYHEINENYELEECSIVPDSPIGENDQECNKMSIYALDVYLTQIPDGVKIVITNDQDNNQMIFEKNSDINEFMWTETQNTFLRKLTFEVYGTSDVCKNELLRKFEYTLPRWNDQSKNIRCFSEEYKDTELCQRFIYESYNTANDRNKIAKADKEVEKKEKEKTDNNNNNKTGNFIYDNKVIICVAIGVAIVGVILFCIIRRKKHDKK